MTISSTANRVSYTGNGSTTAFAYPYLFFADTDLVVVETIIATGVQTTQVLSTNYTVTGAGSALGGTVTATTAPPNTVTWTIFRDPPKTQTLDLVANDPLPAQSLENAFDKLTLIDQRLDDKITRTLRQPDGDTANLNELPAAVSRAGKFFGFDSSGQPIAAVLTASGLTASAYMATVLDDLTAAEARATLGTGPSANIKDFGAVGDGVTDDTTAIQNTIDSITTGVVFMPIGRYKVTSTLNIKDGIHLIGEGSKDTTGTVIEYAIDSANPLFLSPGTQPISHFRAQDFQCLNTILAPGSAGAGGHCWDITLPTNNTAFVRVEVRNFGGSAFKIRKATAGGDLVDGMFNVYFEQVFISSCGAYGFDIDGRATGTWIMCDINSTALPGFIFRGGTGNQSSVNIYGLAWEGGTAWASNDVIEMNNTNGMPLNIFGGSFTGSATAGGAVVKMTNTTIGRPSFHDVTGLNFDYLLDDQVNTQTWNLDTPGSMVHNLTTTQLISQGPGSLIDLYDLTGSVVDKRRWRMNVVDSRLLLQSRLDNGGASQNIAFFHHDTKLADFQGTVNATGYQLNNVAVSFTTFFESAEQVITAAGALTIAHGLGAEPKMVQLWLINKTAEAGYLIGDKVLVDAGPGEGGASRGASVVPDATNLNIRFGATANTFLVFNKTTGATVSITNANWKLIVRAWT